MKLKCRVRPSRGEGMSSLRYTDENKPIAAVVVMVCSTFIFGEDENRNSGRWRGVSVRYHSYSMEALGNLILFM